MKPLWLKDIKAWNKLKLVEQLEALRQHYCTGPCGQSSSVLTTREVTNKVFLDIIDELNKISDQLDTAFWEDWINK